MSIFDQQWKKLVSIASLSLLWTLSAQAEQRPGTGSEAGLKTERVTQLQSALNGLCLDVQNSSLQSEAKLQLSPCENWDSQRFELIADASGAFELRNTQSGLCVDVRYNAKNPGAEIIQYSCQGSDNQKLFISQAEDGSYQLRFAHSYLCLDFVGDSTFYSVGGPAIQEHCHADSGRNWKLRFAQ